MLIVKPGKDVLSHAGLFLQRDRRGKSLNLSIKCPRLDEDNEPERMIGTGLMKSKLKLGAGFPPTPLCPNCHTDLTAARESIKGSVRPPTRRRGRRGPTAYAVEVLGPRDLPANLLNPYSTLSPSERYECLMRRLAKVWSAICRRRSAAATPEQKR